MRPFNCYGPRQSARAVIPTIISQLAAGNSTIKLGALTPTRDFNFIDDTVSGFIAALEAENGVGETVNLGSNFEISIAQTAELISEVMDVNVSIKVDEQGFDLRGLRLIDYGVIIAKLSTFLVGRQNIQVWRE